MVEVAWTLNLIETLERRNIFHRADMLFEMTEIHYIHDDKTEIGKAVLPHIFDAFCDSSLKETRLVTTIAFEKMITRPHDRLANSPLN